ncbi:MAG: UMP kinase [Bacteroidales bacterium]|nr:UMP kinase [Bacteroidales bacterium]
MKYGRILLKLSGEALAGASGKGLDENQLTVYARQIAQVVRGGTQVAIVVGGGNIFRGLAGVSSGFERVRGDQMGMLATVINSIGLSLYIKAAGVPAEVFSSIKMEPMCKYYVRDEAVKFMEAGGVALIAGGTGNPFFSTDSASALRACEIGADALLKGTKVDGVYDSDPMKNPNAQKYGWLSYDKALADNLKVMDATAFTLCRENNMPIVVFNMNQEGTLEGIVAGENLGTVVCNE